jgi:hypothetical protein
MIATTTDAIEALHKAAEGAFATVANGLATRKAHPSYGYTKAGLTADLNRAIGIAQALAVLTGRGTTDTAGVHYAEQVLMIDVRALRERIKAA